ncbi:MAG: helix-turn-helix domain-containing protein, partial [Myxococcota bacterium]
DIPVLASALLDKACASLGKPASGFSNDAMSCLLRYQWPGNVRELKNVMERAVSLCDGDIIQRTDLQLRPSIFDSASSRSSEAPHPIIAPSPAHHTNNATAEASATAAAAASTVASDPDRTSIQIDLTRTYKEAKQLILDQFERDYVARIFETHGGNISQAARTAGLTRYHLRELLKKHDLLDRS